MFVWERGDCRPLAWKLLLPAETRLVGVSLPDCWSLDESGHGQIPTFGPARGFLDGTVVVNSHTLHTLPVGVFEVAVATILVNESGEAQATTWILRIVVVMQPTSRALGWRPSRDCFEVAAMLASGARSVDEVHARLVQGLHQLGTYNLHYDPVRRHYTGNPQSTPDSWTIPIAFRQVLRRLRGAASSGGDMSCDDMSASMVLLAEALGGELELLRLAPKEGGRMRMPPVFMLGFPGFRHVTDSGLFSHHVVSVPRGEALNTNTPIFDPCIALPTGGSTVDPDLSGFMLVAGMPIAEWSRRLGLAIPSEEGGHTQEEDNALATSTGGLPREEVYRSKSLGVHSFIDPLMLESLSDLHQVDTRSVMENMLRLRSIADWLSTLARDAKFLESISQIQRFRSTAWLEAMSRELFPKDRHLAIRWAPVEIRTMRLDGRHLYLTMRQLQSARQHEIPTLFAIDATSGSARTEVAPLLHLLLTPDVTAESDQALSKSDGSFSRSWSSRDGSMSFRVTAFASSEQVESPEQVLAALEAQWSR